MKEKIYYCIGIFFLFLILVYSFESINSAESGVETFTPGKKLLITAMHCGFNPSPQCSTEFNSYHLIKDTLQFNAWHRYGCWFPNDNLTSPLNDIADGVNETLTENDDRDLRTIFDRPVVRYVSYGQRSDYQCERIAVGSDYYFHAYNNSVINTHVSDVTDNMFNGGGAKVKFCHFAGSGPGVWSGYVVDTLRANREQCNRIIDHTRDDTFPWYVKPRIRIDTAFANNSSNQNVKVCRIDIFDWNDSLTKSQDIIVGDFKSEFSRYTGNYLEEYYFAANTR